MKIPLIDLENDDTPNDDIARSLLEIIAPALQEFGALAMAEIIRFAAYRLSKKDDI